MRAIGWWLALGWAALAMAMSGCDDSAAPPHGHVGTFDVRAAMMVNSCGPQAVQLAANQQYQARLGYDGAVATWELVQSRVSATGSWTDVPPSFRFVQDAYVTLRAAVPRYGLAACVLRRYDQIEGTLDGALHDLSLQPMDAATLDDGLDATSMLVDGGPADAGTATFGATETIVYGVVDGADCRDFVGAGSGQFITFPCQITYAMNGSMIQ